MVKPKSQKKIIAFAILFLFITISNSSILGDDIETSRLQNIKDNPKGIPLSDDYVDAYWMFDECSGDTVGDSSGHDYDGIIYDTSWISGYSNCGLEFDGIDDYVDLDVHAVDLGFNKTDDLIFSLWFRSDSTTGGYIYCISGIENVPEALIELCPNGSFHFKIWTSVCGIDAYSKENHNDGTWHHAVAYFNGITAKPTMEIYIDDELEGNKTRWLCEVINTDFNKVKLGRRAQSGTKFFEGIIDEFKIIKYPNGNEQDPPDIIGPHSGYPQVEYEFTFTTEDPEGDNTYLFIDWGDTTFTDWFGPFIPGEEVTVSHKWSQEGAYEIRAKSKDYWDDSRWSDVHAMGIGNVNPDTPIINGPTLGGVGTLYEYELFTTDPDGDDVYYFMDWDDGDNSGWIGPFPSGESVKLNHTWTSQGSYYLKSKAKDIYNAESPWTDSFVVTIVENDPPTNPTIDGPNKAKVGIPHTFIFTSTDSNGDDVSYYIDWGDGTTTTWSSFQSSGSDYIVDHEWKKQGKYTIEAKAKDIYNTESDWTQLEVEIPRNRAIYLCLFNRILEFFPIIHRMLNNF